MNNNTQGYLKLNANADSPALSPMHQWWGSNVTGKWAEIITFWSPDFHYTVVGLMSAEQQRDHRRRKREKSPPWALAQPLFPLPTML